MAGASLPSSFRRMLVSKLSSNFRQAVKIVDEPLRGPQQNEVIIKNRFVGVNATDINVTAGRYAAKPKIPFGVGLEGTGEIAAIGSGVTKLKLGQPVAFLSDSAYSEYVYLKEVEAFPVPEAKAEYVTLLVSGLTASIALDVVGEIKKNEVVLITAAAGGLGQFAVQWAKRAGCEVVGTCSTATKEEFLKKLGCDRVINYKKDNLDQVIKEHYPKGIDVVWETVGGSTFEVLSNRLAKKGRLIIIGATSGYSTEGKLPAVNIGHLPIKLLFQSSSIRGFFLPQYLDQSPSYFGQLVKLLSKGELLTKTDDGNGTSGGPFRGLDDVYRAVDHLQSGESSGKVVVAFP